MTVTDCVCGIVGESLPNHLHVGVDVQVHSHGPTCTYTQVIIHTCTFKNMYILGLVFGVIGGFITPAFSFILS